MADPARFKFQLRADEHDQFERGDEWFVFDIDKIDAETTTAEIIDIEMAMGKTLDQVVHSLAYGGATYAKLLAFWIARRLAGVKDEKLEFFTPRVRAASVEYLEDTDVDPPAPEGSSGEPSEVEAPLPS